MKYIIKNGYGKYWLERGCGVTKSKSKAFKYSDTESRQIVSVIPSEFQRIKVYACRPSKRKGKKD